VEEEPERRILMIIEVIRGSYDDLPERTPFIV
jgi:hypothetical protein